MKLEAEVKLKVFIYENDVDDKTPVKEVERNIKRYIKEGRYIVRSVKLKLVKEKVVKKENGG